MIEYDDAATERLDFFDEHDVALGAAFDRFFDRLEGDPSDLALRRHYFRGEDVYLTEVPVAGRRDDFYYVAWQTLPDETIWVKAVHHRTSPLF